MTVSFLKKGKDAHAQVEKADQETEKKKAAASVRRFFLPKDKETQITFLDGDLDEDGLLETVTFWEHNLRLNGRWFNYFTCTQDDEPCPICQGGDTPSLVAVFSIIDHTKWVDKNSVSHQHERRLFACKRETFKRLQKLATKRKGLAGVTFDVSRIGEKSPAVGSDFDFSEKRAMSELIEAYSVTEEDVASYNYEEIITYRNAEELRGLGFGIMPIGAADTPSSKQVVTETNYDTEL